MADKNPPPTPEDAACAMLKQVVKNTPGGAKTLMDQNFSVITKDSGAQTYSVATGLHFERTYLDNQFARVVDNSPNRDVQPDASVKDTKPPAKKIKKTKKDDFVPYGVHITTTMDDIDPTQVGYSISGHFTMRDSEYEISEGKLTCKYDGVGQKDSPAQTLKDGTVVVYITATNGIQRYPISILGLGYNAVMIRNHVRATYPFVLPSLLCQLVSSMSQLQVRPLELVPAMSPMLGNYSNVPR